MRGKRLILLLCCVALALLPALPAHPPALAEEVQQDVFVAPTLPSDAEPYDETHPEELSEDQLYAQSAILVEATSGDVIFEKNADASMYPASTTKIMTTLLGVMMGDLTQTVTLTPTAGDIPTDSSTIPLSVGETINFKDLLFATMVRSGNEGANLIAETVAGNQNDFVALMNQAAAMYGCTGTHFANPSGYHDENHYTTARDMAKIAAAAMQNETFRDIAKTYTYSLPRSNLQKSRVLKGSGDGLLNPYEGNSFYYPAAIGIKTGFHSKAGYCYVGAARKEGVELISVVFYTTAEGRWTDTKKLMEYGFSQFVSITPKQLYEENPLVVETNGFSREDTNLGRLELDLQETEGSRSVSIVATKTEVQTMARNLKQMVLVNYTRDFTCPITQGEVMGTLTYYPADGGSAIEYNLVASRSIARRENAPKSLEEIEAMVNADPNPFPPMSVELVLLLLIPVSILALFIWLLRRIFHRGGGRKRHSRVPKPSNRYFR